MIFKEEGKMPPITRIQKENILQEAYEIVRKKGMEGVNARSIAKRLNCSIQPIFHKFSNMEELKKELTEKIVQTYLSYMLEGKDEEDAYKKTGINYIRFAREEPKLFQILFMSEHKVSIEDFMIYDKSFEQIEKSAGRATGFSGSQLKQFHMKIWVFTHGLATMLATQTCEFSQERVSQMLTDVFTALYKEEKRKGEEKYE